MHVAGVRLDKYVLQYLLGTQLELEKELVPNGMGKHLQETRESFTLAVIIYWDYNVLVLLGCCHCMSDLCVTVIRT